MIELESQDVNACSYVSFEKLQVHPDNLAFWHTDLVSGFM